jgi:glycosyltransferase involved in cell wall biosynthesis
MKMDKKPLVSIVIPAYNIERYIVGAVESALAQTYRPLEIIVTDDGSTDGTKTLLEPYIAKGEVRYIYQKNKGIAGARNTAIRAAKGEYIALLDGDDLFLPEKISRQVAYLEEHPECDASYCGIWIFYDGAPDDVFKLNYTYYSGIDVFPNLLRKQFINPTTLVIRRTVFEKFGFFDEKIGYCEDWELCLRIVSNGGTICFLSDYLAKCRWRAGSTSYSMRSKIRDKKVVGQILSNLRRVMTEKQAKETRISSIIFLNELKLLYMQLAARFNFLASLLRWLQGRRLRIDPRE